MQRRADLSGEMSGRAHRRPGDSGIRQRDEVWDGGDEGADDSRAGTAAAFGGARRRGQGAVGTAAGNAKQGGTASRMRGADQPDLPAPVPTWRGPAGATLPADAP
jgi:hypothetical protein